MAALAVVLPCGVAHAASAPHNLHAFMLRADEPVVHTFSRTPSFAWSPVSGAKSYQFELSTSKRFNDSGIVWSSNGLTTPAVSVPISLPWMTGNPYSLYAHVRAVTRKGPQSWSTPFGFNMRWSAVPAPVTPAYPGLLHWSPVAGANGYMVWLLDAGKWFTTRSNMADEREYYTLHQGPAFSSVVHWRVRPIRWLYGDTQNGVPSVSYGPWSPIYTNYNPPFATGPLKAVSTVSDVVSDAAHVRSHDVMPAFIYQGNTSIWNTTEEIYRVEVFTDEDCLNVVFRGAMTGAPAYVPRPTGPLGLPADVTSIASARSVYLKDGSEPDSYTYDGIQTQGTESEPQTGPPPENHSSLPAKYIVKGAKVDLWDSNWAGGRYYWTVMPIDIVPQDEITTTLTSPALAGDKQINVTDGAGIVAGDTLRIGDPPGEIQIVASVAGNVITLVSGLGATHLVGELVDRLAGGVNYDEAELTQDACASGRRLAFSKSSEPAVTGTSTPYASGLSPNGKLSAARSAKPSFYGQPLVAWQPAAGADQYEVQWSRKLYPWRAAGSKITWGTALTLPLKPGTWYYRVRGLDYLMTGSKPQMSWSNPVRLLVTKPRFRVVG